MYQVASSAPITPLSAPVQMHMHCGRYDQRLGLVSAVDSGTHQVPNKC